MEVVRVDEGLGDHRLSWMREEEEADRSFLEREDGRNSLGRSREVHSLEARLSDGNLQHSVSQPLYYDPRD